MSEGQSRPGADGLGAPSGCSNESDRKAYPFHASVLTPTLRVSSPRSPAIGHASRGRARITSVGTTATRTGSVVPAAHGAHDLGSADPDVEEHVVALRHQVVGVPPDADLTRHSGGDAPDDRPEVRRGPTAGAGDRGHCTHLHTHLPSLYLPTRPVICLDLAGESPMQVSIRCRRQRSLVTAVTAPQGLSRVAENKRRPKGRPRQDRSSRIFAEEIHLRIYCFRHLKRGVGLGRSERGRGASRSGQMPRQAA